MQKPYASILLTVFVLRLLTISLPSPFDLIPENIQHEPRKFKASHKTSLFIALQSTNSGLTRSCEASWLKNADDYFIFKKNFMKRPVFNEKWTVAHFMKLLSTTYVNLPHQSRWILFTFDDSYYFIERIIQELSTLDSHQRIYSIIRDGEAKSFHRPAIIMSRNALDIFYERIDECSSNISNLEQWLISCLEIKSLLITRDFKNKSRCFALSRHFEIDEMKIDPKNYNDGFSFINKHSSSLLSFTNLSSHDMLLLPILIERIHDDVHL